MFIKWLLVKFGYRFWYEIKLEYFLKASDGSANAPSLHIFYRGIGLKIKSEILDDKDIKKAFHKDPLHKYLKSNGILVITGKNYLGFFKR
jgi:predicted ribosome quality control (RQC) complex YloA/Tae2 family protein